MKGTITIVGNDIKLTLDPESDVERLVFRELGDDMSISRCHHSIVLRRRGRIVHSLLEEESAYDAEAPRGESAAVVEEASNA